MKSISIVAIKSLFAVFLVIVVLTAMVALIFAGIADAFVEYWEAVWEVWGEAAAAWRRVTRE